MDWLKILSCFFENWTLRKLIKYLSYCFFSDWLFSCLKKRKFWKDKKYWICVCLNCSINSIWWEIFNHLILNCPDEFHVIIEYLILSLAMSTQKRIWNKHNFNSICIEFVFLSFYWSFSLFSDDCLIVMIICFHPKRIFLKSSIFTIKLISLFKERD